MQGTLAPRHLTSFLSEAEKIETIIDAVKALKENHLSQQALKNALAQNEKQDLYLEITLALQQAFLENAFVQMKVLELADSILDEDKEINYDTIIGKLNALKSIKAFNLTFCKDKLFPSPEAGKNTIILFIQNHFDGVGDFMHGVHLAEHLKEIVGKEYEICAVVVTTTSESNLEIKGRAEYVKRFLSSQAHSFDKWYLHESTWNPQEGEFNRWLHALPQSDLFQVLAHAAMGLEISSAFGYKDELKKFLPDDARIIYCGEYGHIRPEQENYNYGSLLKDASMGLKQGCATYGILLNEPLTSKDNYIVRVLEIAQEGRSPAFIQHLTGTQTPEAKDVEAYFRTRRLMSAYMQTKSGATAFILTQILRNIDENGKLTIGCDFLIPKGAIDEAQIRLVLAQYGFKDEDIAFVTQNTENMDHASAKIRIMSFFIRNDEDYQVFYEAAWATGGSGDNTISLCFSSPSLPYIEYKGSVFGEFCRAQLISTLDEEIRSCEENPELQTGLINLQNYFLHLCKTIYIDSNKSIAEAHASLAWCERAAKLSQAPYIEEAWQYFRELLFKKYNYGKNFPEIIKTVLYMSQSDVKFSTLFSDADCVQMLNEMGLLDKDISNDNKNFVWLTMLATPSLYKGIKKGYIDSRLVKMDFQYHLPITIEWIDILKKYQEAIDKILATDPTPSATHGQKLFLAMRLEIDLIDSEWFDICFHDPSYLEAYIQKNNDKIQNKLSKLIKNQDVVGVHIWADSFFNHEPENFRKIIKIITQASESKYYGNVNSAKKFNAMVTKLLSLGSEEFKLNVIQTLFENVEHGTFGEYLLLDLIQDDLLIAKNKEPLLEILKNRYDKKMITQVCYEQLLDKFDEKKAEIFHRKRI